MERVVCLKTRPSRLRWESLRLRFQLLSPRFRPRLQHQGWSRASDSGSFQPGLWTSASISAPGLVVSCSIFDSGSLLNDSGPDSSSRSGRQHRRLRFQLLSPRLLLRIHDQIRYFVSPTPAPGHTIQAPSPDPGPVDNISDSGSYPRDSSSHTGSYPFDSCSDSSAASSDCGYMTASPTRAASSTRSTTSKRTSASGTCC